MHSEDALVQFQASIGVSISVMNCLDINEGRSVAYIRAVQRTSIVPPEGCRRTPVANVPSALQSEFQGSSRIRNWERCGA